MVVQSHHSEKSKERFGTSKGNVFKHVASRVESYRTEKSSVCGNDVYTLEFSLMGHMK